MRVLSRWLPGLVAACAINATAAGAPAIPEGSADQMITLKNGPPVTNKVYALGSRIRSEADFAGRNVAAIMDLATQDAWVITPSACRKEKVIQSGKPSAWPSPTNAKEELVGSETIEGHPAKKYRVTTVVEGQPLVSYLWRAMDLRNWPIRVTDEKGELVTRYANIDLGKPDPKLFEPPAGCGS